MTWFNTSYLNKKQLTIDHTKVSGGSNLSSFPVLISRTDTDLKVVGSGGSVQNSSGFDIIFTDSTESTKLDHEIEKYVSTTGEIEMWVRIPTLSASADTIIYMYFNNSSISTSQENKTGVWDTNYKAVWHLKEATGTNASDSTSNAITATQNASPVQGAGQIDGSLAFDQASSQYLSVAHGSAADVTGDKTVEIWVKPSGFGSQLGISQRFLVNNIDGTNAYFMSVDNTTGNGLVWAVNDSSGQNITSNTGATASVWTHLVGVYTASTHAVTLYINGSASANNEGASGFGIGTSSLFNIARRTDAVGYFTGSLDEIRISNVVRTAGWITTSYNSQSSPSTFYSVGSIQTNVTANTMSGTESNTGSDLGGMQSWGVESNSGSDILAAIASTVLIESSTASDVGGSQNSGVESNTVSDSLSNTSITNFIENNSIADNALYTAGTAFAESNTGSDNASFTNAAVLLDASTGSDTGGQQTSGVESNTATDVLSSTSLFSSSEANAGTDSALYTAIEQFTESNIGSDIGLNTSTTNFVESGTGFDVGGSGQSGVENLIGSDSLLATAINNYTEGNSGLDNGLFTANTNFTENNSGSDSLLATANTSFIESTTGSDVGGFQSWLIENLIGSDALLATASTTFIENSTGSDSPFYTIIFTGIETLTGSDSGGLSAPATTNTMSGEEDLVGSDVGGLQSWLVDALAGSDSLLMTNLASFTEANTGSDTSLQTAMQSSIEQNIGADSALYTASTAFAESNAGTDNASFTINTSFIEQSIGSDSGLSTAMSAFIDALVAGDVGGMQQSGVEALIIADSLNASSVYIPVEALISVDVAQLSGIFMGVESNTGSDSGAMTNVPASIPSTNAIFYVRSGKATFFVRKGNITFRVRG